MTANTSLSTTVAPFAEVEGGGGGEGGWVEGGGGLCVLLLPFVSVEKSMSLTDSCDVETVLVLWLVWLLPPPVRKSRDGSLASEARGGGGA